MKEIKLSTFFLKYIYRFENLVNYERDKTSGDVTPK